MFRDEGDMTIASDSAENWCGWKGGKENMWRHGECVDKHMKETGDEWTY